MSPTITAFERSPDRGRGLARDMHVRWALEEVGQPYDVRLLSFSEMKEAAHRAIHPFGQIPTYEEGDLTLFESGAIVFHLAERHAGLLPDEANGRTRARSSSCRTTPSSGTPPTPPRPRHAGAGCGSRSSRPGPPAPSRGIGGGYGGGGGGMMKSPDSRSSRTTPLLAGCYQCEVTRRGHLVVRAPPSTHVLSNQNIASQARASYSLTSPSRT